MLKVGKVCDFCSHNDFLPFVCPKCTKTCCTDHREVHPCTAARAPKLEATGRERSNLQPRKIEREPVGQTLGSSAPKSGMTPAKLGVLEKLRAHMAQSPRYQQIRDKPVRPRDKPAAVPTMQNQAQGDAAVPPAKRHYMHIRRPPASTNDPITGSAITRPELVLYVFYDKSKPIGSALDKAKKSLQMSAATGLELQGTKLPLSSPIGAIPPNSTLTVC